MLLLEFKEFPEISEIHPTLLRSLFGQSSVEISFRAGVFESLNDTCLISELLTTILRLNMVIIKILFIFWIEAKNFLDEIVFVDYVAILNHYNSIMKYFENLIEHFY